MINKRKKPTIFKQRIIHFVLVYYTEKSLILRIAKLGVFFHTTKQLRLYIKVTESLRIVAIVISYRISKCDTTIRNGFDRLFIDLLSFIKEIIRESREHGQTRVSLVSFPLNFVQEQRASVMESKFLAKIESK